VTVTHQRIKPSAHRRNRATVCENTGAKVPLKVCLSTNQTVLYPQGGHLWVFINWALGLRSCGCEVTWLDVVPTSLSLGELLAKYKYLQKRLSPFKLDANLVVDFLSKEKLSGRLDQIALPCLDSLGPFDLLVDLRYDLPKRLFDVFRRTVLINIDPGLYEQALAAGVYPKPGHDLLFSIGETGQAIVNKNWLYTPPCVFLDEWPPTVGSKDAPWTTIAHWWGEAPDKDEESKRRAFEPFMMLPSKVDAHFELALNLEHDEEQRLIESYGFKVHDAHKIVATPSDYRSFIQSSAGEFSCAKAGYVKSKTAWISDRTLCYLASGRPCVIQNTGPSRFLPDQSGLHRFFDLSDAVKAINAVIENYEHESLVARSIAEEFFDAHKVCRSLLSRSL
jgi:hypothetical protein